VLQCLKCDGDFATSDLVFGTSTPSISWLWFHVGCYTPPHQITYVTDIEGFDDLVVEEQAELIEIFEKACE